MKYNIIIFDFDNTLCNRNVHLLNVNLNDINVMNQTIKLNNEYIHLKDLFNKYDELILLLKDFKNQGVKLCIASFGSIDTINKIINIMFPNIFDYIITPDNVAKEANKYVFMISRHIVDLSCPSFYGKNIMINTIMKQFNITDPTTVLFFDDDSSNTLCSKKLNIVSHNNNPNGITVDMLKNIVSYQNGGHRYIKYYHK